MIKDIQQHNENLQPNDKQISILKKHFPSCFKADGSFDIERFKNEIKDKTDVINEGYELKFLGKSYAKLLASTDTTTVIQPNEAHNGLPENAKSENIYISGDNLDGLKHLLKSYQGAIKCIYIDPPYNTGSDGFVYRDNFNYTKENLQEKLSVGEEEAERILELTKRGSASHSAWLMFMYSRLLLARDLLASDGVIFISIDDNEQANLKLLCDDLFGEENFIANLTIKANPRGRQSDSNFATLHDFLLCYAKRSEDVELGGLPLTSEDIEEFDQFDEDGKAWRELGLRQRGSASLRTDRPEMYFPIYVNPNDCSTSLEKDEIHSVEVLPRKSNGIDGRWMWGKDKVKRESNRVYARLIKRRNEFDIFIKDYLERNDEIRTKKPRSMWLDKDVNTEAGGKLLKSLLGKAVFSYPKPIGLIKRAIYLSSSADDIILDFFSGSATTAQAVMQLNSDDEGNRKFISVQLPEILEETDPSQKVAYEFLKESNLPTTLDYIGFERIKRSAAKIKQEHPDKELDLGFKHYILAEPNQNTLDRLDSFDKAGMLPDTTILEDFGKSTILATWLNADGYGLTVNAQEIDLAGYTAYHYDKHLYFIDPGFNLDSMKALLAKYDTEGYFNPENIVLFGYSFPDWSINEMMEKNLKILNDSEKNLKINYSVRY